MKRMMHIWPLGLVGSFLLALSGCLGAAGGEAGGAQPPGSTAPGAGGPSMMQFANCMNMNNWTQANMKALATMPAQYGTICADCHVGGQGGLQAGVNDGEMFQLNQSLFTGGFFTVQGNAVTPAFEKLKATGSREGHPLYLLRSSDRQALEQFVQLTNASCGR